MRCTSANFSNGSSPFDLTSSFWIKYISFVAIIAVFAACANVKTPTGGPDDKTPPQVLNFTPDNFSTNFASRRIVMQFDEWIQLKDVASQLIVSPPMDPPPKVTLKKKSVIVELPETLHDNTTYSISFGEGIVDYRASNPASDLRYVFSTGDELDSLHLNGLVIDAFSGEPVKDVKIMLYDQLEDSVVTLEKPLYFGMTDEEGKFDIDYLRGGDFKCFALIDDNANYLLDESESHGWIGGSVSPLMKDSLSGFKIRMSVPESTTQFLEDYESDSSGFVTLAFTKRSDQIKVEPVDAARQGEFLWAENQDSALFWLTSGAPSNEILLKISDGDEVLDTIEIEQFADLPSRFIKLDFSARGKIARDQDLSFESTRILKDIDQSKVKCFRDSLDHACQLKISKGLRSVTIDMQLADNQKYRLELLPGAVTSREGWTNDSLEVSFSTHETKYYGNLDFSVSGLPMGQNIVQFIDSKDKITYEFVLQSDTSFRLNRVLPETFRIRAIHDLNGNGKWDAGDYWSDVQPENVLHYVSTAQMRSNWDQIIEWRIISQ